MTIFLSIHNCLIVCICRTKFVELYFVELYYVMSNKYSVEKEKLNYVDYCKRPSCLCRVAFKALSKILNTRYILRLEQESTRSYRSSAN
jgi:hypothetical protein